MDAVDAHHTMVHGLIDIGSSAATSATAQALRRSTDPEAASVHDDDERITHVAVARAAFGDVLPDPLNPPMSVRSETTGEPTKLAVFLHGLGGHEKQWQPQYLATVSEAGYTCLQVRYSTGRSIHDNAAELVQRVAAHLPSATDDGDVLLVGHSMGGLIIAEALARPDCHWAGLVGSVVTLGTPFGGAPLERFARATLAAIASSDVAAPIVALGDHRSVGIKELGDGIETRLPSHVSHHAVVACLGATPQSPKSRMFGDGLVPVASALGPEHPSQQVTVLGRTHHNALLDHPEVTHLLAAVVTHPD